MHDLVTGRSASGILEFLNQTPIDWMSKRQAQVETATYGSEFMVARQATERLIDLRYTLRSLGVPLDGPAWLFGDNQSVVTSSTIPHSTLSKRWNALSYHKVREAIAGGWLRFEHLPGTENPADIMTKSLPWFKMKVFVEPMLFWKGDTTEVPSRDDIPEGSVTSPGHDGARDSIIRDPAGETPNRGPASDGTGQVNPGVQTYGFPRGNRCAALFSDEWSSARGLMSKPIVVANSQITCKLTIFAKAENALQRLTTPQALAL